MISHIDHVVIFVTDMDRAIEFYTKTLGFGLAFKSPEYTSITLGAETSIGLHIAESVGGVDSGMATTQVSFMVDDIQVAYDDLMAKGVTLLREIEEIAPGRKMFNFADPDNNSLSCYMVE